MLPEIIDRYREIAPDIYRDCEGVLRKSFRSDLGSGQPELAKRATSATRRTRSPSISMETASRPSESILRSVILFDHNADGVKTGTGWLNGDDAWLVLDRDGNGTIDSGRELFGVETLHPRARNCFRQRGNALLLVSNQECFERVRRVERPGHESRWVV